MEELIEEIKRHHRLYRGKEATPEDIKDALYFRSFDTYGHINLVEVDGEQMRERGCSGPCACTGACKELIPATPIDVMVAEFAENLKMYISSLVDEDEPPELPPRLVRATEFVISAVALALAKETTENRMMTKDEFMRETMIASRGLINPHLADTLIEKIYKERGI